MKVTPAGSVPVSPKEGAGRPVAVAAKDPGTPTMVVAELAEVIDGGCPTVSVKLWVTGDPIPLLAVIVIGYVPTWVAVPDSTPVKARVTPEGRVPV